MYLEYNTGKKSSKKLMDKSMEYTEELICRVTNVNIPNSLKKLSIKKLKLQ